MTAPTHTLQQAHAGSATKPGRNDLREVLLLALAHHREGRASDARRIYDRILVVEPEQPDALHFLGVLHLDEGNTRDALALLARAVAAAPDAAAIRNSLGSAQRRAGNLELAIADYRRAIDLQPTEAAFRTNLAAALADARRFDEARAEVDEAIRLAPSSPDAHFVLGSLYREAGDHVAAEPCFARAASSPANAPAALLNLGNTRRDLGRAAEAIDAYRTALTIDPRHVEARLALGVALASSRQTEDALSVLKVLVEQVPEHRDAWFHLGGIAHGLGATPIALDAYLCAQRLGLDTVALHSNLGLVLAQLGHLHEAATAQRRAIALEPGNPELRVHLAVTLRQGGRIEEAAACCEEAIGLDASFAPAYSLLGGIRMLQHRHDAAVAAHECARSLAPDSPIVLNEFANAFMDDGNVDAALALYREALGRAPHIPELHLHLALAVLATGRLDEGWSEYAWRHALPTASAAWAGPGVPWSGEALEGKRLLVWREQGLGDELMFASCLADLVARGARVVLLGTPRLIGLYRRSLPEITVVDAGDPHAYRDLTVDYHVAVGDLPAALRRRIEDFPERLAFLRADPARVAHWRTYLRTLGTGPAVGVCWRSGLLTPTRQQGYATLPDWAPVLQTPGVQFVNLQYDECSAELAAIQRVLGVTVHRAPDLDLRNDLDEAAALTAALDLTISAPTAVGELAGALGVPTWRVADERDWTMLGTDRRPWYPAMDVFARAPRQPWSDLLVHVAGRLAERAASRPTTP